jgi:chloramphenicol O-acetyltransferase type A
MKKLIDIENWDRKEHFLFFSEFSEPFFGVTTRVVCTRAYERAKQKGISFFLYYLYRALKAVNAIDYFRYRIIDGQVYEFETINASPTISRSNGTFGFSYLAYCEQEEEFYQNAEQEIEVVKKSHTLFPAVSGENVIHFSAIPWIDFSSVSHARNFAHPDSCPKISFGKLMEVNGVKSMAVSIHVHHALMDGFHVGQFIEQFQALLEE